MKTMSTRDTIAELVGAGSAGGGEEPVDEGPGEGGEGGGLDDGVGGEDAPVETQPEGEQAPVEAKSGPARAPDGKFTAADKAPASVDPARAAPTAPKPVEPAAPKLKPPANWRPAAQAEFDKLPRVVQEESLRIHAEVSKTLNDTASHRQAAETWQRTLAPYEHLFRAVGKSPVEGVGWLVQQYAALQTAPIPHRAAIIGGLVRDFLGTDTASIQLLADALEGKGGAAPTAPAAPLRPEQIRQLVQDEAQRLTADTARQAEIKAIQDFEASAPEYLPSLTNEITALVAIEKRQGKPITVEMLKQVHAKALRLNPETAAILKQRDDAAAAAKRAADDKKKQAAATGIKNEPAGPGAPAKAVSTRDEVKRQMDRLKGGARV